MRTSTSKRETLRALIDAEARRAGFDAVAVTIPNAIRWRRRGLPNSSPTFSWFDGVDRRDT